MIQYDTVKLSAHEATSLTTDRLLQSGCTSRKSQKVCLVETRHRSETLLPTLQVLCCELILLYKLLDSSQSGAFPASQALETRLGSLDPWILKILKQNITLICELTKQLCLICRKQQNAQQKSILFILIPRFSTIFSHQPLTSGVIGTNQQLLQDRMEFLGAACSHHCVSSYHH